VKIALGLLTMINVALTLFGASMAMMSPMMFDSGVDGPLLWAVFWSILAFPLVALLCAILPWLFLWLRWPRIALVSACLPPVWMAVLFAVVFTFF
jgi:hypothetical protein